jgi:hypothetical protein
MDKKANIPARLDHKAKKTKPASQNAEQLPLSYQVARRRRVGVAMIVVAGILIFMAQGHPSSLHLYIIAASLILYGLFHILKL